MRSKKLRCLLREKERNFFSVRKYCHKTHVYRQFEMGEDLPGAFSFNAISYERTIFRTYFAWKESFALTFWSKFTLVKIDDCNSGSRGDTDLGGAINNFSFYNFYMSRVRLVGYEFTSDLCAECKRENAGDVLRHAPFLRYTRHATPRLGFLKMTREEYVNNTPEIYHIRAK